MPGQPVGPGIERPGLQRGAFIGLLAPQIAGEHIVADRRMRPSVVRADADALDGVGAVRRDMEHLLPRQRGFYRPLKLPGGDGGQNGVGVDP